MAPFRSDRSWRFPHEPQRVWNAVTGTDRYREWWPWLRRFEASGAFGEGTTLRCEVSPPLPYVVRFRVQLEEVEPGRRVAARVSGDIEGRAELELHEDDGTLVRLVSVLRPVGPVLRAFAAAGRPMVEWGHRWVLDQGADQFARRGLDPPSG